MSESAARSLAHDDPLLRYRGAVSLERTPRWTAPWRLPHEEAALHLPEGGVGRAAMPSGVRVTLRTDSPWLHCRYQADPAPRLAGPPERARLDVLRDGRPVASVALETHGGDAEFRVSGLTTRPGPTRGAPVGPLPVVELWLPYYHRFRLCGLTLAAGATVAADPPGDRPRWVHYGSSISLGRGAHSPSRTWPALVARRAGWDLTSLALGAGCYLQPMTARLMRDLPAELLTVCVGINVHALGTHSGASLTAALIGFVRTVRDGHPDTPFGVMSTIVAPEREEVAGPSGLTVRESRERVRQAVRVLREHGDSRLHYLHGPRVFGPSCVPLLLEPEGTDRLHPSPAGHPVFAGRFLTLLRRTSCVPEPARPPAPGTVPAARAGGVPATRAERVPYTRKTRKVET
ncbi:G-D-S-L family lipolytic protein [Streptomyces sp. AC563]|uniref:GDSL-type esterase/lipase family protein n=1 Tax=Streptomyces buecherae TaxID=2763006 RepID=UPI00164DD5DB|nr:GDSL-type esterase/lipase family protein [Streptomyces buecherae]MBC3993178.1 G-D-S-L family lipolytic protein [Streptomyces buecherae]